LSRDHLKSKAHKLSQEYCDRYLKFNISQFQTLETLDRKWKLVYHILFPEVPLDQIPSSDANEDAMVDSSSKAKLFQDVLKIIQENNGTELKRLYPEFIPLMPDFAKAMADFANDQDSSKEKVDELELSHAALGSTKGSPHPVQSSGLPKPWSSTQNSPRTTMEDEGYCGLSPLLTNKGPTLMKPLGPMPMVTHPQSRIYTDAKPVLANAIRIKDEAQSTFMGHAAPRHTAQIYTPQYGTIWAVDYYTVGAPLGNPGYTQPNAHAGPSFTPNPTLDDCTLYSSYYDTSTDPSPAQPFSGDWEPTLSSKNSPFEHTDLFLTYNYNHDYLYEEEKPTPPPSSCMKGLESLNMDDWVNHAMYDSQ
jgi:hypothetical protein